MAAMPLRSAASAARAWARALPDRHGGAAVLVALAVIVLLGLVLRLGTATDPNHDQRGDWLAYERIAQALYEEGQYGDDAMSNPSEWSPGAPFLYAAVYAVTGAPYVERGLILVAFLGAAMVLGVYLLGRRLGGTGRTAAAAGLIAATVAAVYPTYIEYGDRLVTEPIAAFLVVWAVLAFLWAFERRQPWAWLAPGVLLGALAMTRPEYLVFGFVFGLVALLLVRHRRGWRPALVAAALLVGAFCAVLAPWTVRNLAVHDRFVPVSTGGGRALFVGTYLPGDGENVATRKELNGRYGLHEKRTDPLLDVVARQYPQLDRDAALGRIGRENLEKYASEQPGAYAGMLVRKAATIWHRGLGSTMAAPGWRAFHLSLLALAVVGLGRLARQRRVEALVLALPIAGITVLGALLLAPPRRNVPLMPLVIALSAAAAVWLAQLVCARVTERRRERASAPSASLP